MTTANDPWTGMSSPPADRNVTARRADPTHPYDFFWGLDALGRVLLVLEHDAALTIEVRRPTLRGIDIVHPEHQEHGRRRLILALKEPENREIFYRLCLDILDACRYAGDQRSAVQIAVQRTWRWHQLLRGGASGRLSTSEQKGLIGELAFMRDVLVVHFGAAEAVSCWKGPLGEPKDFAIGSAAVETKVRSPSARPFIEITSAYQLDRQDLSGLFLYVVELESSTEDGPRAFTLDGIVRDIRNRVMESDIGVLELLNTRLMEAGYFDEDGYGDAHWVISGVRVYAVEGDFPRIERGSLPSGIAEVRYRLDLKFCGDFVTGEEQMVTALQEGGG